MTLWAEPAAALLVTLAAALAVDRALFAPSHRPLAYVLCLAMLEPLRPDTGAVAMALHISLAAVSAWLAVRVLLRRHLVALCAAALVFVAGAWRWNAWETAPVWAAGASLLIQGVAVVCAVARRRLWLADRCVVVLAAGDLAAFLGPLGDRAPAHVKAAAWWIVQWQAAGVAGVLCGLHIAQALQDRRRHG